jgi:TonB family protein
MDAMKQRTLQSLTVLVFLSIFTCLQEGVTATVPASNKVPTQSATNSRELLTINLKDVEIVSEAKAVYPKAARKNKIQDRVMVLVYVNRLGDVTGGEVTSGDSALADAALSAARQYKFKPIVRNGEPVDFATTLPIDFSLTKETWDSSPMDERPIHIAEGAVSGYLLHKVNPAYPKDALRARIKGKVIIQAIIGKDGIIHELHAISGPNELIPSALGAVKQWRYRPYLMDGKPVEVSTQITVSFDFHY